MPKGNPTTVSVIRVPPAVEPRRGEMLVTVGVIAAWYRSCVTGIVT
jgi:hypothetical protein